MDEIKLAISFIEGVGLVGLLIILAIPKLKKLVFGNGGGNERLEQYYNHDLTAKLTNICNKLDKAVDHLDDMRVNGVRIKDK